MGSQKDDLSGDQGHQQGLLGQKDDPDQDISIAFLLCALILV